MNLKQSDFLSRERIKQEVKEDFGSGWKDLDNKVKEQLISGRGTGTRFSSKRCGVVKNK